MHASSRLTSPGTGTMRAMSYQLLLQHLLLLLLHLLLKLLLTNRNLSFLDLQA